MSRVEKVQITDVSPGDEILLPTLKDGEVFLAYRVTNVSDEFVWGYPLLEEALVRFPYEKDVYRKLGNQ